MSTTTHLQTVVITSTALLHHLQSVHWNLTGPHFYATHNLTEDQYTELFTAIDDIAERLRALGQKVIHTAADVAACAVPVANPNAEGEEMIQTLIQAHQAVRTAIQTCMEVADDEDDDVTEDLMIQRATVHDKAIWLLQSLL